MAIIRTPEITQPSIKINDLSALNKRLISGGNVQEWNGFLKLNEKFTKQRKVLPELRPSILSASEGKSFAFVSEKSSISTKSTIIGRISSFKWRVDFELISQSFGKICIRRNWVHFVGCFNLTIPIPRQSSKQVSKGMGLMCDGISGGGAKWFVALLPEVGKIDTRLTVAESPTTRAANQ